MAGSKEWTAINQEGNMLNDIEIKNIIKKIIASEKNINTDDVLEEKNFEQLSINSIEFISLIAECEEKFGIRFEDEKLLLEEFPNLESFLSYAIALYNRTEDHV